ncbi:MAG: hypothetical protein MJY73_00225 [Bacteroidales bacterium]|nr:hypothetical protein [Bacteroidales bacterium]
MIEKMTKYSWILINSDKDEFLERLRELGIVDIKRSAKPVDEHSENLISRIEGIKARISELERAFDDTLTSLLSKKEELTKECAWAKVWGDFDSSKLAELGLDLHFYCCKKEIFNPEWPEQFPIQIVESTQGLVWFVVVGDNDGFPLKQTTKPERPYTEVDAEIQAVDAQIAAYREKLAEESRNIPAMKEEMAVLQSDFSLYLASLKGSDAAEGFLTVFEGFAPQTEDAQLKEVFDSMALVWTADAASVEDNPPIKLRNNSFSKQFETLTEMYGMPSYNEFDPTIFLSIFFLLFFSMCMGDAGYGLVLMLVGFLMRKKEGGLAKLWRLIMILGAGTFVVGIVMGGFFGIDLSQQKWVPGFLKKIMITGDVTIAGSAYAKQMILALGIGVVHICLALIMKAVWAVRKEGFKNSLGAIGWTLLIVGAVVILSLGLPGLISESAMKWLIVGSAAVCALGIFLFRKWGRNPLLNIGSGLWDTYSMASGLMGDVLSYIRLYALGLSGGMLGSTFNMMGGMVLGDNPTWQWVPFVLIIIFGHVLNIAMSCLGAFVHPLRLNFVEFFKNSSYEGAGSAFNPIKK